MLRTEDITKIDLKHSAPTELLNKVNIAIELGEFVAIMGPSGSGKTTLLNILGLLSAPTSGKYWFNDTLTNDLPEKQIIKLRKEHIGYVFKNFGLIAELTLYENIELPLLYAGISSSQRKLRIKKIMSDLHLTQYEKAYPKQSSGVIQQKAGIARALVTKPKLILADEPTGHLNSKDSDTILNDLAEMNARGTTLIISTHSKAIADKCIRTIQLLDGQIVTEGVRLAM